MQSFKLVQGSWNTIQTACTICSVVNDDVWHSVMESWDHIIFCCGKVSLLKFPPIAKEIRTLNIFFKLKEPILLWGKRPDQEYKEKLHSPPSACKEGTFSLPSVLPSFLPSIHPSFHSILTKILFDTVLEIMLCQSPVNAYRHFSHFSYLIFSSPCWSFWLTGYHSTC